MKKTHKKNRKLMLVSMAALLPITAAGLAVPSVKGFNANAASSSSVSTTKSYVKEVSVTNNNFNSSSSSYSLSTSLSGWTGQLSSRKTTAGIINTGSSFSNYRATTFYLANNPETVGSDKHVLMINSKTDNTNLYSMAKQGYKTSSSISLSANSYYSFQVSMKGDTNYETETQYPQSGEIGFDTEEPYDITSVTFDAEGKSFDPEGKDVYLAFPYNGKTYYLLKKLNMSAEEKITISPRENVEIFYEDDNFVGFLNNDEAKTPVYVLKAEIDGGVVEDGKINILQETSGYTCDIQFVPNENSNKAGKFRVPAHTPYFTTKTAYNPVNAETKGSIYLSGLTDQDGKEVKAEYVSVAAKEWQTFYFFVATGSEAQNVNLELWLGSKNTMSSGVVFFDDVHVNQYSENAFWKTYQKYYNKSYSVSYGERTKTQNCTNLINLSEEEAPTYQDYNFDFEKGVYGQSGSAISDWKKDENSTGNAQVFDIHDASGFKSRTGYNSVGTNYGCQVEFDETTQSPRLKVSVLDENKYVLGLWTDNNYAKVTSKDIEIQSKKIYRISAEYKISSLKNGNIYLSVKENDHTLSQYSLTKDDYTLAEEASSSGINTNADNDFTNDYGTIEFYVKGNSLINSSVNVSLSLGSASENSTGCVVFDNVKIQAASAEEYDNASNKLQLGSSTSKTDVPNSEFDEVVYSTDADGLYTPANWTITKGDGFVFGGVVNTDQAEYSKYRKLYQEEQKTTTDRENKYFWSTWQTRNKYNKADPDNVLMLANMTKSWQKVRSDEISISANTTYRLSFKYKTFDYDQKTSFKVSVFGEDGFKLYESEELSSTNSSGTTSTWKDCDIYLEAFPGASNIYLEIDLGTSAEMMQGVAYLDAFSLKSNVTVPEGAQSVDMSDFCLHLPINNFGTTPKTGPAYTGTQASGSNGNGGIVTGFNANNSPFYVESNAENDETYYYFIRNNGVGSYTLQSNFSIDLESGSYYELSFKLKTYFNHLNEGTELDANKKYTYGVTFGLTGFEYMTELKSNEDYTTYKMYFNATDSTSAQLYMALVCDSIETGGSMAIYDIQLNDTTEDVYKAAQETMKNKNYDANVDNVFVSKAQETADDDTTTDTDTDTEESGSSNGFNWLLIPTLITALAIVIAIVGYFLRKIKIKKIEVKRKETYDRKRSANVDAIKRKALADRNAEVAALNNTKSKFEQELESLESEHKKKVIELREKDKGTVSKNTDKEFKLFAKKRTVIAEKIEALNKQIEEANTPEHLLALERKAFVEEDNKRRELERQSTKEHKAQEKAKAQAKEKNSKKSDKK